MLFWHDFVPETMRRLWQMLAHENAQMVNYSRLASSLGVSDMTIRRYIDLLKDEKHAKKAYKVFVDCLKKSFTTKAVIFATIHLEGTYILCELLEKAGIDAYVGIVDMDRNCPDYISQTVEGARKDNIELIKRLKDFKHVKPCITPRFTPTPAMMKPNSPSWARLNPVLTAFSRPPPTDSLSKVIS